MAYQVLDPLPEAGDKSHHIGSPPTSFRNPWPSFPTTHASLPTVLKTRFFDERPPFIPVPSDRHELVQVHNPDFTVSQDSNGIRVIWIGHASFLVQFYTADKSHRPLNVLLDPVFSERTSPFSFIGPKRYTPTPCRLSELLQNVSVDVVCISHNHYDHADTETLKTINDHESSRGRTLLFCVPLRNSRWLASLGIPLKQIWQGDWWERIQVSLPPSAGYLPPSSLPAPTKKNKSNLDDLVQTQSEEVDDIATRSNDNNNNPQQMVCVRITCTPSQHASARGIFDKNSDLWSSWSFELISEDKDSTSFTTTPAQLGPNMTSTPIQSGTQTILKTLFFAGDTGYRTVTEPQMSSERTSIKDLPCCPAFAQIGNVLGPFDLALLPIGLNRPRHFMSSVHANAEDSMEIHADIKAKRSVGMHWGTVRGGISGYYEDVLDPPREWEDESRKANKIWRDRKSKRNHERENTGHGEWEIGLLDVGESLVV